MPFAYAEETQHHSNGKRVPGNAVQRPRAAPDLPLLDLSSPPQVETSHRAARADTIVLDDDDNDDEDMYEVHVASDGVNGASQAVDVAERPASNAGAAAGSALDLQRDQEEDEKVKLPFPLPKCCPFTRCARPTAFRRDSEHSKTEAGPRETRGYTHV